MKISDIQLKIIPDSRGNDTIEALMESAGIEVFASVPSGKSTGSNESFVLPPQKTLEKITWIKSQIKNTDFSSLDQFDQMLIALDGTPNKQSLGGNLILALSICFTKLLAKKGSIEIFELIEKLAGNKPRKLPLCFFNVIEGGVHAENSLPFQEYLFVQNSTSPEQALSSVMLVIKNLGEAIQKKYEKLRQGDEGGYLIPSDDPVEGLEMLKESILASGQKGWMSLDVAASAFFSNGKYTVGEKIMSTDELFSYYQLLATNYQLLSIEDPFDEKDIEGFKKITASLGEKIWIVGDDLTTTNTRIIKEMAGEKAANAVILKPNQIGSVSETIQAALLAKSFGWKTIVSHRSGETMDTFIADLAVGLGADGLKSGCPLQKERLVKYQRLIEIEKQCRI